MHRTDAHALFDLITEVRTSGANVLAEGWAGVLGADVGSPEFVRRHAEVVSLLAETLRQIAVIPSAQSRARFEPYAAHWWRALISPDVQWNQQTDAVRIISSEHLHLLGSAADVIEGRVEKTALAPGSFDLETVRAECEAWIAELQDESLLRQPLRLALLEALEHLNWLIDNAERFGVARVAKAGQAVVGALAVASPHVPEKRQKQWTKRMFGLVGSLVMLTTLIEQGNAALDAGQEFVAEVAEIIEQLTETADDDTPAKPRELGPPSRE